MERQIEEGGFSPTSSITTYNYNRPCLSGQLRFIG